MKALLILAAGGLLAWLYARYLNRQSGEVMMGCGPLLLIPFAVIAVLVIVALVVWS